jgi:D-threonate/D-erythronate kinase
MNPFYIVADDLTGASDSGVQFAKRGYTASLLFNHEDPGAWTIDPRVVVVDTDSRAIPEDDAYRRVRRLIASLNVQTANLIFKKVDSTLRGNVRSEVRAALDSLPGSAAFIVPAYPQNGRTTRQGIQYLNRVPVHETEIGRDPKTPVVSSSIPELLGDGCFLVSTEEVERGSGCLQEHVSDALQNGYAYIVFDAETNEHLRTIGQLYLKFPQAVWVGSAGIAEHLDPPLPAEAAIPELPLIGKPLLYLVGSLSESTREQVEACGEELFYTLKLDPVRLLESTAFDDIAASVGEAYRSGKHCIVALQSSQEARNEAAAFASSRALAASAVSDHLREAMGNLAVRLVSALEPECLFLTGGDTARSICEHLGITGMNILSELEPGIPLGRAAGTQFYLVTKAGAFGSRLTFQHIAQRLTKE